MSFSAAARAAAGVGCRAGGARPINNAKGAVGTPGVQACGDVVPAGARGGGDCRLSGRRGARAGATRIAASHLGQPQSSGVVVCSADGKNGVPRRMGNNTNTFGGNAPALPPQNTLKEGAKPPKKKTKKAAKKPKNHGVLEAEAGPDK